MIPGLENADFVRYSVMHRNTFIQSQKVLDCFYRCRKYPKIFFAGQITGVEGYVESASSGIMAGFNMARILLGKKPLVPDSKTCIGALALYVTDEGLSRLEPMNANFGIIDKCEERIKNKQERYRKIAERGLALLEKNIRELED